MKKGVFQDMILLVVHAWSMIAMRYPQFFEKKNLIYFVSYKKKVCEVKNKADKGTRTNTLCAALLDRLTKIRLDSCIT